MNLALQPLEVLPHSRRRLGRRQELHAGPGILILPNAWDAISARIVVDAGAKAVGLGAKFTHTPAVLAGDYASLTEEAAKVVELARGAKAKVAVKV